jgi:ADP-ribose pyrophosphatase YjhB (NUDIX family)
MDIKNKHCSYCGTKFTEQKLYPRKCFKCYEDTYNSPLPVVIVLIPIIQECALGDGNIAVQYGTLIQKRNIEPGKGEWALTGGFIDSNETWKHAAKREVYEELGLKATEDDFKLWDITSNTEGSKILIFCCYNKVLDQDMIKELNFVPNDEVAELDIMWLHTNNKLAFESHTRYANEYVKCLNKDCIK